MENESSRGKQGFASMSKEKVREIAQKGGNARKEQLGHDGYVEMGRKGGKASVQITDENGKKMKGELRCDEMKRVVDEIKSLKNKCCFLRNGTYPYWRTTQQKPSTPSKLIKNEKIDWYLVYNSIGLVITHRENICWDYLLAELFAEEAGFILNEKCKIEIV